MRAILRTTSLIAASLAWACHTVAQETPGPKLPAMPSMDQKGSDDLTKPAGAEKKPAPVPAGPKPTKSEAPKPAKSSEAPKAKLPAAMKRGLPPKQQVSKQGVSKQHASKPIVSKQRATGSTRQSTRMPPPKKRAPRKGR